MNTHANKIEENKSQSVAIDFSQRQTRSESAFQFVDNRSEAIAQRKLQKMANNNPGVKRLKASQEVANNSPEAEKAAQLQAMGDNYSAQNQQPLQQKENGTGLPDNLISGIEHLSGYSMDDVKVHRNSDKPAQLNAHAYTKGTEIHLASGQQRHLPHEAWHVVQQKQGRVKPTLQLKGKVNINDDESLENEADVMGAKATQMHHADQLVSAPGIQATTVKLLQSELTEASEVPGTTIGASKDKGQLNLTSTTVQNPLFQLPDNHVSQLLTIRKVNGAKAIQGPTTANPPLSSVTEPTATAQGKFKIKMDDSIANADMQHVPQLLHALRQDSTLDLFRQIDRPGMEENYPGFNQQVYLDGLEAAIVRLITSGGDFGLIDTSNDQHLAVLYFSIRKYLSNPQQIFEEEMTAAVDELTWQQRMAGDTGDAPKYRTAILGRGASAAYYIASLGASHDFSNTIIIGTQQPWRVTRGPGVVGHPMHMISPMLHFVGENPADDEWANRDDFSDLIDRVIQGSGAALLDDEIATVIKIDEVDMYRITAPTGGFIYAWEVISHLGVGAHNPPTGVDAANDVSHEEADAATNDVPLGKRIFNMDVFTRFADRLQRIGNDIFIRALPTTPEQRANITVILSGGNAGLDVAFDALYKGYRLKWITGGGGATFLPGFPNYAAYLPLLKALRAQGRITYQSRDMDAPVNIEETIAALESNIGIITELYENQGLAPQDGFSSKVIDEVYQTRVGNVAANDTSVTATLQDEDHTVVTGHILVYAQGQDAATKLTNIFGQGVIEALPPMIDKNQRFSDKDDGETVLGKKSEDDRLQVFGATAFRTFSEVRLTNRPEIIRLLTALKTAIRNNVGYMNLGPYIQPLRDAIAVNRQVPQLRENEGFIPWVQRIVLTMKSVTNSLPDNVLINDQLTAILTQVQAANDFVAYDANQNVNFLIADRTALRIYLTAQKPELNAQTGDAIVQLIIKSRSEGINEIPPAVPPHQARFQEAWTDAINGIDFNSTLGSVQQQFTQAYDITFNAKSAEIMWHFRFMINLVNTHAPSSHVLLKFQDVMKLCKSLEAQHKPGGAKRAICSLFIMYLSMLRQQYENAYVSNHTEDDYDYSGSGPSGGGFGKDLPAWIEAF